VRRFTCTRSECHQIANTFAQFSRSAEIGEKNVRLRYNLWLITKRVDAIKVAESLVQTTASNGSGGWLAPRKSRDAR
jgi:hypothetical protein